MALLYIQRLSIACVDGSRLTWFPQASCEPLMDARARSIIISAGDEAVEQWMQWMQ
jgi:hypothetical protein